MKKRKNASSLIYIIFFLTTFLAFSAFAIDGAIVLTNRLKLQNITEQAALAAASQFNSSTMPAVARTNVNLAAINIFNILRLDSLGSAKVDVSFGSGKNVCLKSKFVSQPFFLAFMGVTGINLEAKACAVSESFDVSASDTRINWVNASAVYRSDIIYINENDDDTAILTPLGTASSVSFTSGGIVKFPLLFSDDDEPLSLGTGGYLTIKLARPVVDKPGNDIFIKEAGDAKEGYTVYAGIDLDPIFEPYANKKKPGAGIRWTEITPICKSADSLPAVYSDGRCYGSTYFDIKDIANVSVVKYLRIVDDGEEVAYAKNSGGTYEKYNIYGDASTNTPGVDIDSIKILNHVRLVSGD